MDKTEAQARASQRTPRLASDTDVGGVQMTRDGQVFATDSYRRALLAGRLFGVNGGVGSSPITFDGTAYDADAPDLHVHVPNGTAIIPMVIEVCYEVVGTEIVMEIIALASGTGTAACTGTAKSIMNMSIGGSASACTATAALNDAGCTDPNAGNRFEFWRRVRQLTDSAATGENDRHELTFRGVNEVDFLAPVIQADAAVGGALVVYAVSEAGTGFISAFWEELTPASSYIN